MTITYQGQVARVRLGGFTRLLLHWKGSIYKLIWKELVVFCALYAFISIIYRCALTPSAKRSFEIVCVYCQTYTNLIPLTFVLGFYVTIVVGRWWSQYEAIAWPDRLMCLICALVHGADERGKLIRRTLIRYLNLSAVIILQSISTCVKKRFPNMENLVDAGFLTAQEKKMIEDLPSPHSKYWVPCLWFCNLAVQARKEGRIRDEIHLKTLLDELNTFRGSCGMLFSFDWVSVPLVYTQVVTLATYTFFLACLFGRQYLEVRYDGYNGDMYVPIFTVLEFFFYMGWLKVAEQLINPFGEDDDDFETNWIIDRNYQVSMLAVDELYQAIPDMEKDIYWGEQEPDLPYSNTSSDSRLREIRGSTACLNLDRNIEILVPKSGNSLNIPSVQVYSTPGSVTNRRLFNLHSRLASTTSLSGEVRSRASPVSSRSGRGGGVIGGDTESVNFEPKNGDVKVNVDINNDRRTNSETSIAESTNTYQGLDTVFGDMSLNSIRVSESGSDHDNGLNMLTPTRLSIAEAIPSEDDLSDENQDTVSSMTQLLK